jgi:ribosomal protein S18 acetylase RimI-like enzyme
MIRPTLPGDTLRLLELAAGTGVFKPHEITALNEVLDDFHAGNHEDSCSFVLESQGRVVGFSYFCQTPMTDRTWELWWIAVDKADHGSGFGRILLEHAESVIVNCRGRLLAIETSSTPSYEATRRFYLRAGYSHCATVPDFYADADGKCIFVKRFE